MSEFKSEYDVSIAFESLGEALETAYQALQSLEKLLSAPEDKRSDCE